MAARYWVGGGSSANWTATGNTNWGTASNTQDNASVPSAADDVYFDGVGTGASNCTIDAAATARSVNCTGYVNTITHNASVTLTIGDGTAGAGNIALKLVAGMTYTASSTQTSAITYASTSATVQDVDYAGKTAGNPTFNGVGGSWKLVGTFVGTTVTTLTLTNGTLDTNGQTITAGAVASSNSNTRTLTLGASTINVISGGTAWNFASVTNLTLNANTSTINVTGTNGTFSSNGKTYYTLNFTGSGTQILSNSNAVTCTNFNRTGTAAKTDGLTIGVGLIVTGTLTFAGNSATNRLLIRSSNFGTARTITNSGATMTWSNVDIQDITLGTSFDASAITGLSGDCGGNTNITFTTAATQYGVGMSGGASWSNSGVWASSSGGTGGTGRVPLPQDDVVLDANSFAIP